MVFRSNKLNHEKDFYRKTNHHHQWKNLKKIFTKVTEHNLNRFHKKLCHFQTWMKKKTNHHHHHYDDDDENLHNQNIKYTQSVLKMKICFFFSFSITSAFLFHSNLHYFIHFFSVCQSFFSIFSVCLSIFALSWRIQKQTNEKDKRRKKKKNLYLKICLCIQNKKKTFSSKFHLICSIRIKIGIVKRKKIF